jgi:hypothetical protein
MNLNERYVEDMSEDPRKYLMIVLESQSEPLKVVTEINPAECEKNIRRIQSHLEHKRGEFLPIVNLNGSLFLIDSKRVVFFGLFHHEEIDALIEYRDAPKSENIPMRPQEEPAKPDNPWPMPEEPPVIMPSLYDVMTGRKPQPPDTSPQDEGE